MRRRAGTEHTAAAEESSPAAAGVSSTFAPSAPLGGHGRSWPRKGSGGAGFEQEDREVREDVDDVGPRRPGGPDLTLRCLCCLLFHPAGQQEPTEGTEAEAIRVNARKNRVTAAAGVSPMFAPAAPLGGHGRSWPRKGSGGAGFEQEDLEVREDVKTWDLGEPEGPFV